MLKEIDLTKYEVFHDSEFTRMADLHFLLLVMSTLENNGYFPHDNEVEKLIAAYNDEYANAKQMKVKLTEAFKAIDALGLSLDSIWFRKSNFFTTVVEIAKAPNVLPSDARQKMNLLEERVLTDKGKANSPYGAYYNYMYQNTNARKARVVRGNLFQSEVMGIATSSDDPAD